MTKAEIQLIRSLDDKRGRAEAGLFVAEGEKLVREILASGFRVRKVYYTERPTTPSGYACHPSFQKEGSFPRADSPPSGRRSTLAKGEGEVVGLFEQIPAKDMERASRLKTPTDCLALVEIPQRTFDPATLRGRLTLALDEVQNPGNMGTIIRLADWFGITDILCSEGCADCFNPKVVQATMGAITRVGVYYGELESLISAVLTTPPLRGTPPQEGNYPLADMPVYGTFLEGENIYDAGLTQEGVIVLGSEGRGISAGVERLVTRKLFIPSFSNPPLAKGEDTPPCKGGVNSPPVEGWRSLATDGVVSAPESLNVAIAAAIVCSEFRRRR